MSNKLVDLEAFDVIEMTQAERVSVAGGGAPQWAHDMLDAIWDALFG